jgi:serine/threonine protein kinase/CheY-like chemotaxis protein
MGPTNSLVGRTIVDRYEITSLLNSGGMGEVYRARQRALDRPVAIKFIHQHLLASPVSIQRFMVEARTLSRLHHPHVVSVLDFGRVPDDEGGHLFLVMELLSGRDLADVLESEPLLPLPRVIDIVVQILEGLAEAHHAGIVHRDIKPENILLEPLRSGRDHVKIIDFGVAKFGETRQITQSGTICGTLEYMAPEQVQGAATPAVDIYSGGVVLYQMLTGSLPSAGRPLHLPGEPAPVPDPRAAAPERGISDGLATTCMRALEFAPEHRFPTVQVFAEAIRDAMLGGDLIAWDRPSWPMVLGPPPSVAAPVGRAISDTVPAAEAPISAKRAPADASGVSGARPREVSGNRSPALSGNRSPALSGNRSPAQGPVSLPLSLPLFGREADVGWACELVRSEKAPPVVAFWGRPGVGRTRVAREVAAFERGEGSFVTIVRPDPPPFNEVGYRGLRQIVRALTGRTDEEIANDTAADRWSLAGLRMLFARGRARAQPTFPRRAAAAALSWSIWRAGCRGDSGRVLLVVDDVDRLDGASLLALRDHLAGEPLPGFSALLTSEHARTILSLPGARERALRGLERSDAERMLGSFGGQTPLWRMDDDIEPLYVERMADAAPPEGPLPTTLEDLIDQQLAELTQAQRRIIHALMIVGLYDVQMLGPLLRLRDDPTAAVAPLIEKGWLDTHAGLARLRHSAYGRASLATGTVMSAATIHGVAARELRNSHDLVELRAFHAIHGAADFEAFLLLEESARARTARGDKEGAIAALGHAVSAARAHWMSGEAEAASAALGVFGRKLAAALVSAGRMEEAQGILDEILETTELRSLARAALLEQCAIVAELRGRNEQAARQKREALEIAERSGDRKLVERLRTALNAGPPPQIKTADTDSYGMGAPPLNVDRPPRSVLIVEDDPAIREALQSALEAEGHVAHGAGNGCDALDILGRIPKPGLILLDLMMPVMSGWELLERLRADPDLSGIPVVVVSAVVQNDEIAASRVLKKPIELNMLLRVVEELCE